MTDNAPERFDPVTNGNGAVWMEPDEWGDYVRHSDYTAVCAERDALKARADLCDPLRDERVLAVVQALEAVVFAAEAHDETGDMMQEYWLDDARAALRAIKEPKP